MKRAFVSIASSYVGFCVATVLGHHGYDVVGSCRTEDTEDIDGIVSQTVDVNDEARTAQLALRSNVVVLCLIEDLRGADAVLAALRVSRNEPGGPSHLLVLSTTMTWANTKLVPSATASTSEVASHRSLSRPVSMMAMSRRSPPSAGALPRASSFMGGFSPSRENSRGALGTASSKNSGRFNRGGGVPGSSSGFCRRRLHPTSTLESALTEGDYLLRQPPTGYLEHKRLEALALSLQSTAISACVVGAGVPYGLGEGPLLRLFREAWRAGDAPIPLPTCAPGDNHLALIHVVDLSVVVGKLLRPGERDASPAPFPKPYILAVEGGGSQCTAKELTQAIGRCFGGSGETRPLTEAELESILIDDPAALSMLIDARFSNDGGVLEHMVADGEFEPVAWSKGFVTSARLLTREFVTSRSLTPINGVILGPPGGDQSTVCDQVSKRYGVKYVDAKVAMDSAFSSLGKALPEPVPPEAKAPPPAKGKKGKDSKKGAGKGELSPEARAALDALSPPERILHDMQAAFEAADKPMSEYTSLDADGLARLLSPSLVARAARLLLRDTRRQWGRRGYILCNIPSRADAAPDIFGDASMSLETPSPSSKGVAAGLLDANLGGKGGGAQILSAANPTQPVEEEEELLPTHVVYLDASIDYILAQRGEATTEGEGTGGGGGGGGGGKGGGGGGKGGGKGGGGKGGGGGGEGGGEGQEPEGKLRSEIERYFAEEGKEAPDPGVTDPAASAPGKQQKREPSDGLVDGGERQNRASAEESSSWVPATAGALRDRYMAKTAVVAVDDGGSAGAASGLVDAVCLHLTGGQVPAFIWMLSGGGDDEQEGSGREVGTEGSIGKFNDHDDDTTAIADGEDANAGTAASAEREIGGSKPRTRNAPPVGGGLSLTEVLAKLTARDAKEVDKRTQRHRKFLTSGVVPQVAAGLVAAAEARPEDPLEFLAAYLIRAGKSLQMKAEAEAALKYQAGLALLKEMEEMDAKRAAPVHR